MKISAVSGTRGIRFLAAAMVFAVVLAAGVSAQANIMQWDVGKATIIDLSHTQNTLVPADPSLTTATLKWFARVGQGEGAFWNLENITYTPHVGTHMDSPFHVNSSWGALETVNPTVLIGPAVVLDIPIPQGNYTITAVDIIAAEARGSAILPGDGVLLNTGFDKNWPNKTLYIDNGYPILSKEAAEYLVFKKARYVGMECISPDGPNTITHKILLGGGVIVIENLANFDKIGQSRCFTIGTFPSIDGATGAWIRLLAVK